MFFGQYMIGATILVLIAEILAGRHKGHHGANEKLVLWGSAISGVAIARPLSALLQAWLMGLVLPQWQGALGGISFWPAFFAVLLVAEFTFYWVHRWAHEAARWKNPWLWRLHRTHHSARYMSVLLTVRINPFWYFVVPISWVTGISVYLGQEAAAAAAATVIYAWNLMTHANFRWDDRVRAHRVAGPLFRALEHIIVSPGVHHSHHGYGKDGGPFRNYAVTFAFFDWMFGTLYIPKGRPWRYGIPGKNPVWLSEILYPVVPGRTSAADAKDKSVPSTAQT